LSTARVAVVIRYRIFLAITLSNDTRWVYTRTYQCRFNRVGTALGQVLVVGSSTFAVGVTLDNHLAIRVLDQVVGQGGDAFTAVGFQVGTVEVEQYVTERYQCAAISLLGVQALQLFDLRVTGIQQGLGTIVASVFQLVFSSAQGDGLLGQFNTLVGQVSQLVDLGFFVVVLIGLFSLVQPLASVFGLKRCNLGRFRVGLQGGVVALGNAVGVLRCVSLALNVKSLR